MVTTQLRGEEHRGDEAVARIGDRILTRREIDCRLHQPDLNAIAAKQNRAADDLCLEREQEHLQRWVMGELVEVAVRVLGVAVSDAELAKDAEFHRYNETEFVRLSEFYRRIGRAVLLVRQGNDIQAAYGRELLSAHISRAAFERFVSLIRTTAAAEQFIERHSPAHFRESIRHDALRRVSKAGVEHALAAEAAKRGVSTQIYAASFWRELAAESGVEILDPRYKLKFDEEL